MLCPDKSVWAFAERPVCGILYLNMMGEFVILILEEECPDESSSGKEGPSRFHEEVTDFSVPKFPVQWLITGYVLLLTLN
jgi:hypothetical protein